MGRRRASPSPTSHAGLVASLGYHGVIRVLFETPSGFAIFSFDGLSLLLPGAMEDIWAQFGSQTRAKSVWLRDFQVFEDKSGAINHETGICDKLSNMLKLWCRPGQKLAVGRPEYKTIIEAQLGIPCLYDKRVMEVMWGIKNLMHSMVPEEKSQLAKEDRLQMSLGLKMLLNRYGFDVKPEIVSDPIIVAACTLYDCDLIDKKVEGPLRKAGNVIKDVSNIDCEGWDLLKLATALKLICFPGEEIAVGNPQEMFSTDELSKLVNDAPRYKHILLESNCWRAYDFVVYSYEVRIAKHKLLGFLVKEAEKAFEAGGGDDLRSWGLDELSCGGEGMSKKLGLDELSCGLERPAKKLRRGELWTGGAVQVGPGRGELWTGAAVQEFEKPKLIGGVN